jgi:hypothetical protein
MALHAVIAPTDFFQVEAYWVSRRCFIEMSIVEDRVGRNLG